MESLAGDAIESVPEKFRKSASNHVLVFSGLEGRELGEFIRPPGDIPAPQDSVVSKEDAELMSTPEGRAKLARRRVRRLYGDPVPPLVPLKDDPFGLAENCMRSMASSGITVLELKDEVVSNIDRLIEFKGALGDAVATGLPMHTAASAAKAKKEITVLSVISLAFIALLSAFVFRSVKWLYLIGLSLATSALAGLLALSVLFGGFHLMTLVFGTTILGLVIDYSFHWLLSPHGSGDVSLDVPLVRNLVISWATTELSLLPLLVSSLPVLRQSAVFLGVGLAAALAFVLWCYPRTAASASGAGTSARFRKRQANPRSARGWNVLVLAEVALVVVAVLCCRGHVGTTPESLYRPDPALAAADARLAALHAKAKPSDVAKLYAEQGGYISAALGLEPLHPPAAAADKNASFDAKAWFMKALRDWTREAVVCLSIACVIMLAAIAFAYRTREAAAAVTAPSFIAISVVACVLRFTDGYISLFHLMAMFLLLGMSLDYSVFLVGSRITECGKGDGRRMKPVVCSLATSMVGFGLLAFVSFPVVRAFGTTLGIGLPVGFLSALAISRFLSAPARGGNSAEHGATPLGMETLYIVYRVLGLRALEFFASAVGLTVWLFSPAVRRNSPRAKKVANFARSLADKLVVMAEGRRLPKVVADGSPDAKSFVDDIASGRGVFVLSSHVGTIEVLAALGETERTFHAWMEFERTGVFNRFYLRHAKKKRVVIHPISEFGVATAFEAGDALERGDALLMAADRTFGRVRRERAGEREFTLAEGAFRFAKTMGHPVYFIACIENSSGSYTAFVKRLDETSVDAMAKEYATALADLAEKNPMQYFRWETEK